MDVEANAKDKSTSQARSKVARPLAEAVSETLECWRVNGVSSVTKEPIAWGAELCFKTRKASLFRILSGAIAVTVTELSGPVSSIIADQSYRRRKSPRGMAISHHCAEVQTSRTK